MPVFELTDECVFPPPQLARSDGLLAIGGDLSQERLLLAYRLGIFPWYNEGDPILWWSPDPRLVLMLRDLHVSRRLERTLRQGAFRVTLDTAFARVIEACASVRGPGREDTWITPDMMRAYTALHDAGHAHSVECWRDDELVGGMYGVSLGACFFGESMFSLVADASKIALVILLRQLDAWGFDFLDCQVTTEHMLRFGAKEIPRTEFLARLLMALRKPPRHGQWRFEPGDSGE